MTDEPTLPPLPAVAWDQRTQSISTRARKRARLEPSLATSSDPAFFSSDDDPSIENYTPARRKKRLVGSWYEQQPVPSSDSFFGDETITPQPRPNRKFARHFDSGVWMGDSGDNAPSDDSPGDYDVAGGPTGPLYPPNARLPQLGWRVAPQLSEAEVTMRKVIQLCIDEGLETIDISGLNLRSISSETIAVLSTLAPIPVVAEDVPFEPREPNIKLFVANNDLTTVPGSLFSLKNLTSLSLRGNRLAELPDLVGDLTNLRELNVAQNRLKYLPSSLLKLLGPASKMTRLSIQLNDFLEPDPSLLPGAAAFDAEFRSLSAVSAYYVTRSPIRYPRSTQESLRWEDTPPLDTKAARRARKPANQHNAEDILSSPSKIPSLTELASRKCYQSSMLRQLPAYLGDSSYEHLRILLERLIGQREAGGVHCSTCDTLVATPALQWIEWWVVKHNSFPAPIMLQTHDPDIVPFLYVGCTAACGPRDLKPGTALEDLAEADNPDSEEVLRV